MVIEIYYFSGTGNSLYIARELAKKLDAKLIPIASVIKKDKIRLNADKIGIIFPVYINEPPVIVKKFIEKLENLENKYIFAVSTYGGAGENSVRELGNRIHKKGGKLKGCFGVQMPQNAWLKGWENKKKIIKNFKKRVKLLTEYILNEKEIHSFSNPLLEILVIPFNPLMKSASIKHLIKVTNSDPDKKIEELIPLSDKTFSANNKCISCGTCVRVCPVNNIKLENKKPKWLNKCEGCLACYSFCPVKAIEGGFSQKGFYYLHPDLKESDMVQQKS